MFQRREESWLDHVPKLKLPSPIIEPLDRIVGSRAASEQLKSFFFMKLLFFRNGVLLV